MRAARGTATVVGWSMRPLLRPGARVSVRSLSGLPPLGAILVYAAADRLVIHRLIRIERRGEVPRLVTKGDLSPRCDSPIEPQQVLGEVVQVEMPGRSLAIDSHLWRAAGWLFATCAPPFAPLLRRATRVARRLVRAAGLRRRAAPGGLSSH